MEAALCINKTWVFGTSHQIHSIFSLFVIRPSMLSEIIIKHGFDEFGAPVVGGLADFSRF